MKTSCKKILVYLFFFLAVTLQAMPSVTGISGKITDRKTGETLPGAHVILVKSRQATVSGHDGSFFISTSFSGEEKIEVSYMGYQSRRVPVTIGENKITSFDISLEPTIYSSDEVVITASRRNENLGDVPARISVISRNDMQRIPHQTIEDVLRYAAGINVLNPAGIYSMRPVVTLRGLSGDEQGRTLVLLDGVPLNKGDTGGVNWARINPDDIERIEVFHGPGSSVYGNNAMGGVINIITRKPVQKIEGSARLSYGTFNTLMSGAGIGGYYKNGMYFRVSGMYNNSDGYNDLPAAFRENPDYSVPRFLEEYNVSAKSGWMVNPMLNAEVQYDHYRNKKGEGEKIQAPEGEYRHFDTDFMRMKFYGGNETFSYDFNAFYQHEKYFKLDERMRGNDYSRFDVMSDRIDKGMILNLSHRVSSSNKLVYGAESRFGSVNGGDYYVTSPDSIVNRGKLDNLALFVQDDQKLLDDRLTVTLGLRYDVARFHDGEYITTDGSWTPLLPELKDHRWSELSPRIAAGYQIAENSRVYASWSRGFRASILDDLCRSGWMWVGPKIANPDLGPETIDNYEAGGDFLLLKKIRMAPSIYLAHGKDFLYYVATGDSLWGKRPVYQRQNITQVNILGAELQSSVALHPKATLFLNYTFSHSKIGEFEKNPGLEGKALKYTPKHQLKTGVDWNTEWFDMSISAIYKSRQYTTDDNSAWIEPYVTFDAKISREIGKKIMVYASAMDLLDNQHLDSEYYLSPGRTVTIGAGIKF